MPCEPQEKSQNRTNIVKIIKNNLFTLKQAKLILKRFNKLSQCNLYQYTNNR
jgi:hypothetical protein